MDYKLRIFYDFFKIHILFFFSHLKDFLNVYTKKTRSNSDLCGHPYKQSLVLKIIVVPPSMN